MPGPSQQLGNLSTNANLCPIGDLQLLHSPTVRSLIKRSAGEINLLYYSLPDFQSFA
ncbi:hypothetical protein L1275_003269 [Flavobacterium sp. HSC-61S13]|nr:hypothetical protein [Flavobacterium sp. HSC-61S13]